jgi:NADH:ubiquinone oxidoreductase subunit C
MQKFLQNISLLFPFIFYSVSQDKIYIKILRDFFFYFIFFLKIHSNTLFHQLLDITFTDFFFKKSRFEALYFFLSFFYNIRIILNFSINENQSLESITTIFPSAD